MDFLNQSYFITNYELIIYFLKKLTKKLMQEQYHINAKPHHMD